jgi:hypothetical protein
MSFTINDIITVCTAIGLLVGAIVWIFKGGARLQKLETAVEQNTQHNSKLEQ